MEDFFAFGSFRRWRLVRDNHASIPYRSNQILVFRKLRAAYLTGQQEECQELNTNVYSIRNSKPDQAQFNNTKPRKASVWAHLKATGRTIMICHQTWLVLGFQEGCHYHAETLQAAAVHWNFEQKGSMENRELVLLEANYSVQELQANRSKSL